MFMKDMRRGRWKDICPTFRVVDRHGLIFKDPLVDPLIYKIRAVGEFGLQLT